MIDSIGKLVGLAANVAFLVFCGWYVLSGRAAYATKSDMLIIYIATVLAGGAIPNFFVPPETQLKTRIFTIGGGCVIAIAAIYFASKLVPEDRVVYVRIECNNDEHEIPPVRIAIFPTGRVFSCCGNSSEPRQQLQGLCSFEPGESMLHLKLVFQLANGFQRKLELDLDRTEKTHRVLLDNAVDFVGEHR